jgi:chromosome condensin MukBEF ATPase and DNA-binding subunit MukB
MREDRIQEEIEKMWNRRQAIANDLKTHSSSLSAISQVILMGEMAVLEYHVNEMKRELQDMGWQEFIWQAWNETGYPNA